MSRRVEEVAADPVLLARMTPASRAYGAPASNARWIATMSSIVVPCAALASSTASSIASTLAKISLAVGPALPPVSMRASALARSRASTCIPSTFDDAIDSVRRSSRANGASAGYAREFRAWMAPSASETTPATSLPRGHWSHCPPVASRPDVERVRGAAGLHPSGRGLSCGSCIVVGASRETTGVARRGELTYQGWERIAPLIGSSAPSWAPSYLLFALRLGPTPLPQKWIQAQWTARSRATQYGLRSSRLRTFPAPDRGSTSTNSMLRGAL